MICNRSIAWRKIWLTLSASIPVNVFKLLYRCLFQVPVWAKLLRRTYHKSNCWMLRGSYQLLRFEHLAIVVVLLLVLHKFVVWRSISSNPLHRCRNNRSHEIARTVVIIRTYVILELGGHARYSALYEDIAPSTKIGTAPRRVSTLVSISPSLIQR